MTQDDALYRFRLRALALATELGNVRAAWADMTIQYRRGVRLLRKERLQDWIAVFEKCQGELEVALADDRRADSPHARQRPFP